MLRSAVLMGFLTLVWGINWPVMKFGVAVLPALWFRALSLGLGTLTLGVVLVLKGTSLRLPKGQFARIFPAAFLNIVVWYTLVTLAISLLPAGRAAILGFTMPAWIALIGVTFYRERLDGPTTLGVVCVVVGIGLLVSGDWTALVGHPLGMALMLTAAASWGLGTHLMRRAIIEIDTLALTFWMMLIACPFVFAMSLALEWSRWVVPQGVAAWWPILYNAVLCLAMGNFIWFSIARKLPPVATGLSSMMIPVVGVFSGIVLLGETPGWRDWVALALISVAVIVGLLPKSARAAA